MIVRAHPTGRSFKWLATYLTHDPKAQSSERVMFTHTLNLAFDDTGSAVDTMLRTYQARDILKRKAGVRPGGSSVEKPVKHVSLSWHPSEKPGKEAMIAAAESYLRAMGWQDQECLIVGHSDKHPHIHLMLNAIHPERGTRLDDSFERRRSQAWAHAFEKETGKILCAERQKPIAERQPSPPRNVWQETRRLDARPAPSHRREIDYDLPPRLWRRQEWSVLKERQKDERVTFFEDLVGTYRVYRQQLYNITGVSFRSEWAGYYKMARSGASAEALKAFKEDLVSRQKEAYQRAVRDASPKLREANDRAYKALLVSQKAERAKLIDRQEQGLHSPQLHYQLPIVRSPPPQMLPRALKPSTPQHAPERPFVWPAKAGMAAQQRTAIRWLDRALDRIKRQRATTPPALNQGRSSPVRDRVTRKESKEKGSVSAGIEPDGCGGSGL